MAVPGDKILDVYIECDKTGCRVIPGEIEVEEEIEWIIEEEIEWIIEEEIG